MGSTAQNTNIGPYALYILDQALDTQPELWQQQTLRSCLTCSITYAASRRPVNQSSACALSAGPGSDAFPGQIRSSYGDKMSPGSGRWWFLREGAAKGQKVHLPGLLCPPPLPQAQASSRIPGWPSKPRLQVSPSSASLELRFGAKIRALKGTSKRQSRRGRGSGRLEFPSLSE